MRKLFICLANSKKYGERCVAGIEIEQQTNGRFKLVRQNGKPKWIRPVTRSEHGSIPETWVKDMQLLEVQELNMYRACPNNYQSENVFFASNSFKKIRCIDSKAAVLEKLKEDELPYLFGNCGKAVCKEKIGELDYSLMLIKGEKVTIYGKKHRPWKPPQLRILFRYKQHSYDLPITDIAFLEAYQQDHFIIEKATAVYITVSLGIDVSGWHYKLAAGIICI